MFDFHEKRKIRRVLYSKIFIGGVFIVALILARSAYERYRVERDMAGRLLDREQELHELQERALLLESRVDHLRNERGIEEEIRERFDVVRDGEQVVVILEDESESTTPLVLPIALDPNVGTTSVFEVLTSWFR
jgi:cell division protein FtsB